MSSISVGHTPVNSSLSGPVESVVTIHVLSKESNAIISISLILMESPGFTVIQRSAGTPHFCHNSTDFLGPMNGTGISFPFSSVVVIPLLITCAAHSADI